MIKYDKFILDNGLTVLVHNDKTTPVVAINILYNVGAKDEDSELTGFAHLFEHLMFGGSINVPKYDEPLQNVGGENNAFTNNDITNYYLSLPKDNLETGFWIESDRMLDLAFSQKSLDVQKNVVIEEYKQRYLNQPYGDIWLILRPLVYKVHPYQWSTIGKNIQHIENAKIEDVKAFYKKYYNPNNAIMVVAGDVELKEIKKLSQKWFAPIQKGDDFVRNIPKEPVQTEARLLEATKNVPANAIFKVFHCCERLNKNYPSVDFISDLLGNGKSSILNQKLVKEQHLFNSISCYVSGDFDAGIIYVAGYLADGVDFKEADAAITEQLENFSNSIVEEKQLQKIKNKFSTTKEFSNLSVLDKAMNLAYYELLGDANLINTEINNYLSVDANDIQKVAKSIFTVQNSSTLFYKKQ